MTDLTRRPIEFTTTDGVLLRGEITGTGALTIVLVHEPDLDLDAWGAAPERLAGAGFQVLTFDLRGCGASEGQAAVDCTWIDVLAAIGAVGGTTDAVTVVGAGDAAAGSTAAAATARTAAVVLVSPSYPNASPLPERVVMPNLVIVGTTSRAWLPHAVAVQKALGGWRLLVHAGTTDRGTAMLSGAWGSHAEEHIRAFARQAARSRGSGQPTLAEAGAGREDRI
jgi:pimeloyl-ACP methyl ester carboxylesterase